MDLERPHNLRIPLPKADPSKKIDQNPFLRYFQTCQNILYCTMLTEREKKILDLCMDPDPPQNLINSSLAQGLPLQKIYTNPLISF